MATKKLCRHYITKLTYPPDQWQTAAEKFTQDVNALQDEGYELLSWQAVNGVHVEDGEVTGDMIFALYELAGSQW